MRCCWIARELGAEVREDTVLTALERGWRLRASRGRYRRVGWRRMAGIPRSRGCWASCPQRPRTALGCKRICPCRRNTISEWRCISCVSVIAGSAMSAEACRSHLVARPAQRDPQGLGHRALPHPARYHLANDCAVEPGCHSGSARKSADHWRCRTRRRAL